jgi:hypothetical protein
MSTSNFERDLTEEQILGRFLDQKYATAGLTFTRVIDKAEQRRGVDVTINNMLGLAVKVDEKAQLHYLNASLPTFALEISYLKDRNERLGWLFDHQKITEAYAFVFSIYLKLDLGRLSRPDDIKSCDVLLVYRKKLITELALQGIHRSYCLEMSKRLRNDGSNRKIIHNSYINFQISAHLTEQPVNLVVQRKFLESIGKII